METEFDKKWELIMRKSRGRLVVGARAVALAVAVGVVASTGTAGVSGASVQSKNVDEQCAGYTTAEIILGFMGKGVVAEQYPDLALVAGKVVGATPREVEVFLALATLKESGFAEEFRADVTSGDPYRVRDGLERLDTMAATLRKEVTETGTGSGALFGTGKSTDAGVGAGTISFVTTNKVAVVNVAVVANLAIAVTKLLFRADSEEGESGLTTEKAVAIVTKLLAGK
ncbi:hypothetical protein ACOT81_27925 [Streptomyces sp. WI04-05B]|uniref:hypothetical protein n=1 Tax=Streptomyces TaxID=1883 RepID=UPI0029A58FCB|nr:MULTISPECIES: hypothetical protein [unclassified Streptomyces]MDX2546772.1 hypothetical protein [Streptomyces sp. WI04-05B]MDX2589568.1 hypothetical protein [Streptomyces sp. WI04-05A]MDX3750638.1 hypothetical protein [Streptomyces sp. AK08-02]